MIAAWLDSNKGITSSNLTAPTSSSSASTGYVDSLGNWISYNPYWIQPNYNYVYYYHPPIDYALLAEEIVKRLKEEPKSRSIEEVRKELNKLLDELATKQKDNKS